MIERPKQEKSRDSKHKRRQSKLWKHSSEATKRKSHSFDVELMEPLFMHTSPNGATFVKTQHLHLWVVVLSAANAKLAMRTAATLRDSASPIMAKQSLRATFKQEHEDEKERKNGIERTSVCSYYGELIQKAWSKGCFSWKFKGLTTYWPLWHPAAVEEIRAACHQRSFPGREGVMELFHIDSVHSSLAIVQSLSCSTCGLLVGNVSLEGWGRAVVKEGVTVHRWPAVWSERRLLLSKF